MNEIGVYEVTGRREYRGHKPGDVFPALLEPAAEQRGIARGDIRLLRRIKPSLVPGSYELPDGWLQEPVSATTEAPKGASSIRR